MPNDYQFSEVAEEMHAGAMDHAERQEVFAELAEEEQEIREDAEWCALLAMNAPLYRPLVASARFYREEGSIEGLTDFMGK